jgi:hypothetical protein
MLFFIAISCKENTKIGQSTQKKEESPVSSVAGHKPVPPPPVNVPALYSQAEAILKYREENNPKKWAIIDVGVWKYDGIFKDGTLLKQGEVEGKWIDFDQNGNYEYGLNSNILGKGRYHYDNDKSTLLLLDDTRTKKPEEYNARLINGIMIIQGMDTYQDNGFQAKLSKMDARPK